MLKPKAQSRKPNWADLRLTDRIEPGVRVLLVGINPGVMSASTGHHFAGPTNRFWRLLHESGIVPEGIPTSMRIVPDESLEEREEAEGLRQAIARHEASPGPVVPHILLGFLTREEWDRFHCVHAAHHLSFAVPKAHAG